MKAMMKTYKQYCEEALKDVKNPEQARGLMALNFICDAVHCDRKCLEFALKGDSRYAKRFYFWLEKSIRKSSDRKLFLKLIEEEFGIPEYKKYFQSG